MIRLRRHRQLATVAAWEAQLARLGLGEQEGWEVWPVRLRDMRRAKERLLRPRGGVPGVRPGGPR